MKTLIRRILVTQRLLQKQQDLIDGQARVLENQQAEIHRLRLDNLREMHGLVCGWLVHIERPEIDMREELAELDTVLGHRVAMLEEHIL